MHILVTNDDGVTAPGLLALVQAMRALGNVTVVAPDRNWSASGHVKTLHRPLRAKPVTLADGTPALASDGAPSDCVALALMGLVPEPVDLVVSGINPSANIGHDLTYSGTVTAAMEAAIFGVKALAFSLNSTPQTPQPLDYAPTAAYAQRIAAEVLRRGLPAGTLLNVNVPAVALESIRGILITRQGTRIYLDQLVRREDPHGHPYYWIGGDAPIGVPEAGTDYGALVENYISITPVDLDLTAYNVLETLKGWDWHLG